MQIFNFAYNSYMNSHPLVLKVGTLMSVALFLVLFFSIEPPNKIKSKDSPLEVMHYVQMKANMYLYDAYFYRDTKTLNNEKLRYLAFDRLEPEEYLGYKLHQDLQFLVYMGYIPPENATNIIDVLYNYTDNIKTNTNKRKIKYTIEF